MHSLLFILVSHAMVTLAAVRGFNYGAAGQTYDSFKDQFRVAASLANGFTSARLYSMIQDKTMVDPSSAIQAAIDTNTTLLLGLWASQDQAGFDNELAALTSAVSQYGTALSDLVVGISVGSEDLYRASPIGIAAGSGRGLDSSTLLDYISQTRLGIRGTVLDSVPVGHVDTWNVFTDTSNSALISACDFLGLDSYPYYQTNDTNTVANAFLLFFQAYDTISTIAEGRPIWITETGWPVTGPTINLAVANSTNAEVYWQTVACELESRGMNFWWYTLLDQGATTSFGVSDGNLSLYDLTCNTPTEQPLCMAA